MGGDLMCKFGSVVRSNFNTLKNISDVADASKGRPVECVVNRGESTVRLRLTPNSGWGGSAWLQDTTIVAWGEWVEQSRQMKFPTLDYFSVLRDILLPDPTCDFNTPSQLS